MTTPGRKVLLVGKGPPDRGGISAYLNSLLGAKSRLTHDLRILNLTRNDVPKGGRFTPANVTRTVVDAWRVLRAGREADVVHIHTALVPAVTMARAGLLAATARAARTRVVVHVHSGRVELWLSGKPRRILARIMTSAAHTVVAVSRGAERALSGALPPGKVVLIENCVDSASFAVDRAPHDPPRILYAGLLTPRKGVLDLIAASRILAERGVRHELVIAGGTPDEGIRAEAEVRAAAVPPVRLLDAVPHEAMPGLYGEADIFCLPSWWEAMPLSVLEAMAAGLPIVATRVGDIPRAVTDGITGRLVEPRHPAALATTLEQLLDDPGARMALGSAGRSFVESNYDIARMLATLESLYGGL